MSWLLVGISAYLILAIVNLLDKFLVTSVIKNARAYAFVACFLGLVISIIAPWFLSFPGWLILAWNIINGALFAIALWLLYEALHRGEAARILVLIGGLTPIFSIAFSLLFFKENFSFYEWLGVGFLLLGVFVIAFLPVSRSYLSRALNKIHIYIDFNNKGLILAILSAFVYSLYFMSTKQAYSLQPFMSAFIWNRLGAAIFVLLFLISKKDRSNIINIFYKNNPNKNKLLIVFNQALGAFGFILQNYAIFLGSVVLVNALQGVQYAFLLIISTILALLAPRLLKETFSTKILLHKTAAVIFIILGLYFISF